MLCKNKFLRWLTIMCQNQALSPSNEIGANLLSYREALPACRSIIDFPKGSFIICYIGDNYLFADIPSKILQGKVLYVNNIDKTVTVSCYYFESENVIVFDVHDWHLMKLSDYHQLNSDDGHVSIYCGHSNIKKSQLNFFILALKSGPAFMEFNGSIERFFFHDEMTKSNYLKNDRVVVYTGGLLGLKTEPRFEPAEILDVFDDNRLLVYVFRSIYEIDIDFAYYRDNVKSVRIIPSAQFDYMTHHPEYADLWLKRAKAKDLKTIDCNNFRKEIFFEGCESY